MEKPSQSVFARATLSVVCILMQVLAFWLVLTLKWNTRVALLVLKIVMCPSTGEWAGHIPVYWKQLMWSRAVIYQTVNNSNLKLWAIFICLINDGRFFMHSLKYCLLNVTYCFCEYRQYSKLHTALGGSYILHVLMADPLLNIIGRGGIRGVLSFTGIFMFNCVLQCCVIAYVRFIVELIIVCFLINTELF